MCRATRIHFLLMGIVGATVVALPPGDVAGQTPVTTIVNPGFDIGTAGTPVGAPWTQIGGLGPMYITTGAGLSAGDPTMPQAGDFFLTANRLANPSDTTNSSRGVFQDVDLTPYSSLINMGSQQMELSFFYNANDSQDLAVVSYNFLNSMGSTIGETYTFSGNAGGWTQNSLIGEIPVGASAMRLELRGDIAGGGTARNVSYDSISASIGDPPPPPPPGDMVHGNLINFDNDGYWSWYMDERVVVDSQNGKLLIGSVGGSPVQYPVGRPGGSVDVVTFDLATADRRRSQLSDIDEDDHNAPGIIVLPDGRYVAMYSNHGNTGMGDYLSRYRISSDQGANWTAEQSFNWQTVTGWNTAPNANNRVSYHNLYYLSEDDDGEGRLYNFSRGTHQSANALLFNEDTNSWSWGGQLTESATGGYSSGYVKYASNGVDKIYFISTETHPRNYNNNIYAGYISDGVSYDMDGNVVDANLFDNDDTGGPGAVPDITSFTRIFQADPTGPGETPLYSNAWTADLNLGPDGNPVGLFTVRWKEDDPLGNGSPYGDNEKDNNGFYHHTLFYAKYDGTDWHVNPVARMGKLMYLSEEDYTGLGAVNPSDPNTIYISTPLDPRIAGDPPLNPGGPSPSPSPSDYFWTPTYEVEDGVHEIYKGVTTDNGQTWTWTPVTENSFVDNFRPIIPVWDENNTGVIWFRGTYTSAHNTDAAIVGIIERNYEQLGPVRYVDATISNTTRANGNALAASGPSSAEGNAEDNWHWRTGSGNGGDVLASGGSGSEDAPLIRTTLDGLDDGVYDIFAYFWANPNEDWRFLAGFADDDLSLFRDNGTQQAEQSQFDPSDPMVELAGDSGSALYRAYIGRQEVTGGSLVDVFIDDFSANLTTRTWYDGLGYALVSPIEAILAGDYNDDGRVDAGDYVRWRNALAGVGTLENETASLGTVDLDDYTEWKNNYGNPGSGSGGLVRAVPEPAVVMLLLPILVSAIASRFRFQGGTH